MVKEEQKNAKCVADMLGINKTVRHLKATAKTHQLLIPALPPGELEVQIISDAGEPSDSPWFDGHWCGGYLVLLKVKASERCALVKLNPVQTRTNGTVKLKPVSV